MKLHELDLAIAQASRLPRAVAPAVPATVRRNGEVLPKGVYRGYKGQFVVMIRHDGRTHYLGTFVKVSSAVDAITNFQP